VTPFLQLMATEPNPPIGAAVILAAVLLAASAGRLARVQIQSGTIDHALAPAAPAASTLPDFSGRDFLSRAQTRARLRSAYGVGSTTGPI
jgi:hypothetical protein